MQFRTGSLPVLAASVVLIVGAPARASQLAYEGFKPSFPIYANGGTGFNGPWTQGGFNVSGSGYTPLEESLCFAKLPPTFNEPLVVTRISDLLQRAADYRLRFGLLGRDHAFQRVSRRHVNISPHKVDEVRAL